LSIGIVNKLGLYAVLLILAGVPLAFAQDGTSKIPTDKGTLDVALTIKPFPPELMKPVMISFEFVEPNTDNPKNHIDYRVTIVQGGQAIHTTYKQHAHSGADSFSYAFMVEGQYDITVSLEGIDFNPIPKEVAIFPIMIGEEEQITKEEPIPTEKEPTQIPTKEKPSQIPDWIKTTTGYWVDGFTSDVDLVNGFQWLIQNDIIHVPYAESSEDESAIIIPGWIKTSSGFWVDNKISDDEFLLGIEWLINNGIIRV